jgi:predicted RNA-binding Zn ribbon-like protein
VLVSEQDVEKEAEDGVPAPATAVVALLNSRRHSVRPDVLDDPQTALDVVRRFGHTGDSVSAEQLRKVRALRSGLLAVVGADEPDGWAAFTESTSEVALRQDFSAPGRVDLRQVAGDPVVGRIALDVAELVTAGTWARVRLCANEVCATAFYDATRSRTRRWHSYEICGNRTNVRAFRSRRRE